MKTSFAVLGFVACMACGDGTSSSEGPSNRHGGTESLCGSGTPVTTALGWEEASPLGVSAREAFSGLAGSCEAALSWNAEGLSSVPLAPMAGETRITVTVELDESSARFVERQPLSCGLKALDVDAQVRFETADGVFKDGGKVTLSYFGASSTPIISLQRKASELEGSLQATLKPNQTVMIQYRSSGADQACAGELQLSVSEAQGNMGSGSAGVIGRWSSSGCKLGEQAVALDESSPLGEAIKSELSQRWSDASFTGHWDTGAEATLSLAAKIAGTQACAETSGVGMVTLPIALTYASSDGRIARHEANAHINFFRAGDALRQSQLILSETMTCAADEVTFANLDLACDEFARAEAQIVINRYLDGSARDEMSLDVYAYETRAAVGAADHHERLGTIAR